jgi:hypothetical protein
VVAGQAKERLGLDKVAAVGVVPHPHAEAEKVLRQPQNF